MSYKYLDKPISTKPMCDALGIPWDNEYITLDSQELLAEGVALDEDGKDTLNSNYGNRGLCVHTEETKEHLREVITGSHPDQSYLTDEIRQGRSERLTAYNTNRRSELRKTYTDDKEYRKMYMRAWRAKQKEQINNNDGIRR
tara:strand:- start:2561 stop:2986 length:426 start_codon:yes stop_codon:yes gene_type:complete